MLKAILHKCHRHISIVPTSIVTTYGQLYEVCKAFPDYQWISMLAAFTTVVAGSPSPAKVQYNVLAQPNPIHLFAYVTASRQVTTIHRCFSIMSTRMGQPTTQWDGQNYATDMDWTDMGVRTVELLPKLVNRSPQPLCWSKLKRYSSTLTTTHSQTTCQLYQLGKCMLVLRQFWSG